MQFHGYCWRGVGTLKAVSLLIWLEKEWNPINENFWTLRELLMAYIWHRLLPWVHARDSHFAKFAIPRATWERTSGWPHLTIPNKALIPPSDLSFVCSLSEGYQKPCQQSRIFLFFFWRGRKSIIIWSANCKAAKTIVRPKKRNKLFIWSIELENGHDQRQ